ncbi:unnamed protein product [Brassica oleracea]
MTSFPARPLRSSLYVEVIRCVAADGILYGYARILAKRQILGSRIRVFHTMPRDVRDQCVGFRARPRSNHGFRGILMTHSFLERIGQPEVDLANDREESVPFNVLDATFIVEFSSSQIFSMLFRDSPRSTETERNALMLEDFS